MSQEKYTQHYVEILTATMTDCIVRNVSMQANLKIKDEIIEQLNEKVFEFQEANENLAKQYDDLFSEKEKSDVDLVSFKKIKNEYESLKNQVSGTEVFRKELLKERENHELTKVYYENKIKELNEEIQSLKAPVKIKKNVKKNIELQLLKPPENTNEIIKDGGSF